MTEGSGSVPFAYGSGSGHPKKRTAPTDPDLAPDPQHWDPELADLRHSMLRWMKMGPRMGSEFWLGRAKGSPGIGIMHSCGGDSAQFIL
jgi:hypothetical protein